MVARKYVLYKFPLMHNTDDKNDLFDIHYYLWTVTRKDRAPAMITFTEIG